MLDRMDAHIAFAQGRGHAGINHRFGIDRNIDRLGQIHPAKHNARVGLCRAQGELDPLAAVQAHADGTG